MKWATVAGPGLVLGAAALALVQGQDAKTDAADPAQKAEWEEWGPFVTQMTKLREVVEAGVDPKTVPELKSLLEPENGWLKTCAGWTAQEMCATVFGSGLSEETARDEDLGYIPRWATEFSVNYDEKSVVAWCLIENPNNSTYKSILRPGIGCTLVEQLSEEQLRAVPLGDMTPPRPLDPNQPWPIGEGLFPERIPDDVDLSCVERIIDEEFERRVPNQRAVVISYKGELIFEKYAPGITKDNRLLGWSATKSLTQSMIGILVKDGRLNVSAPADIPEWYETEGDPRQEITVDMMLRMSSGTRWTGDVAPTTECIFWSDNNCGRVCGLKPLVAEPDTLWNYNSGSSYLMSRLIMDKRGDPEMTNYEWPKRRLFYPIGAHSMYIEYQPNGNFLGGAYGYGTPRDWTRFGLLFMRDGVWVDGNRILPEGWVKYSSSPSSTNDGYAAHFWRMPDVDEGLFYASGFRNQNVFIFPRQQIIVSRFAMPTLVGHFVWQSAPFLSNLLTCFGNRTESAL